jgi:broad specificity phosphatase PhoE
VILHVVRHAESLANVSRSSQIDCDLSELGRGQAAATAAELVRSGVDRVLSSPYRRTLCTAQTIAETARVPLEVLPGLHEHHPSAFPADWPLMTRAELVVNFPGLVLVDDLADRDWHRPPETDAQVLERMGRVLADVESRYGSTSQRLVLVSHGSPCGKLVQAFMGVTEPARTEVTVANAAITTLEISGGRRYVRSVNRTDHLRDASEFPPPEPRVAEPVTL